MAECAARREFVGRAAAEDLRGDASAHGPGERRAGLVGGELCEGDDGGQRGVAATGDDGVLARELGANRRIGQIEDSVVDAVGGGLLADGRKSLASQRIRRSPGARRVDHGASEDAFLAAVGVANMHRQWFGVASGVDDAVASTAGDADHFAVDSDGIAEHSSEGREIVLHPFASGGVGVAVRWSPTGGFEQSGGSRVDDLGPRREQPHVIPFGHRRSGRRSTFEKDDGRTGFGQVRRGSETDGACADHHYGVFVHD